MSKRKLSANDDGKRHDDAWGRFLGARAELIHDAVKDGRTAHEVADWLSMDPGQVQLISQTPLVGIVETTEWRAKREPVAAPSKRGLDAKTLRTVARRLRSRGRELDKKNKRNKALIGESPSQVRVGRACECDMQADNLLSEARSLESATRKKAAK